jgi:hypothetical protein
LQNSVAGVEGNLRFCSFVNIVPSWNDFDILVTIEHFRVEFPCGITQHSQSLIDHAEIAVGKT